MSLKLDGDGIIGVEEEYMIKFDDQDSDLVFEYDHKEEAVAAGLFFGADVFVRKIYVGEWEPYDHRDNKERGDTS